MHLPDILHDWHDFYLLAGTAAATLVGLMFVAASIGANIFNEENRGGMRAFLSPTVVLFSAVLLICMLLIMPFHEWDTLGACLALAGGLGSIYSGTILVQIVIHRRYKVDALDQFFYALIPVVGYLLLAGSAALVLERSPLCAGALALTLLVLLLAGIRNAWDMTMWIAIRTPGAGPAHGAPGAGAEGSPPQS
jgi:hypothetical protein